MAKAIQRRRGTTAQHSSFTGLVGEITVDTDKDVVVVHDGSTVGGFPAAKASAVAALAGNQNLTGGFTATSGNDGTKSSGTYTPDPLTGNFKYITANGAFTLAPPSAECTMIIEVLNGASAGAITTSGFTKVNGDTYATTNALKYAFHILKTKNYSRLTVEALQ